MGPAKKILTNECLAVPSNATPLRQMSITESFRKAKLSRIKMERPFLVSSVCIVIDSDSDGEMPPSNNTEPGPSPPKIARITNGINASTPNATCTSENVDTSSVSRIEIAETFSLTQGSAESDASDKTVFYDCTNYVSEEPMTSEASGITVREVLLMNDPGNFVHHNTQDAVDSILAMTPNGSMDDPAVKRILNFKNVGNQRPLITGSTSGTRDAAANSHKRHQIVVDNDKPCCSKSLRTNNTTTNKNQQGPDSFLSLTAASTNRAKSPMVNNSSKELSNSACTTPKKKVGFRGGSPNKKGYGSPSNREIKSLKAKEGKQLQVKQLDELVGLLKTVMSRRHLKALLTEDEHSVLDRFVRMEDNEKYVLMKLYVWKRSWYNIFQFCQKAQVHADDKDVMEIFERLRDEKFVDTEYKESAEMVELLQELNSPQIKEVMEELRIRSRGKTKEHLINAILIATQTQSTLCKKTLRDLVVEKIATKLGFAIKLKDDVFDAFYHTYLLATFTNPNFEIIQDYFRSIIYDRVVFPEAPVEDYPVFVSKDTFWSYAHAVKLRRELDEHLVNKTKRNKVTALKLRTDSEERFVNTVRGGKVSAIYQIGLEAYNQLRNMDLDANQQHSTAPHLKKFTAQHVYCGVLSTCCDKIFSKQTGKPLEVKEWLEFLIEKFPQSRRLGKWYNRLIWLHMRHLDINFKAGAMLLFAAFNDHGHLLGERAKYDLGCLGQKLKSSKRHRLDQIYHDRIIELIPRMIDDSSFPQIQIDAQCIRSDACGKKRMYKVRSDGEMIVKNVEETALDHYRDMGYPGGEHCEGTLVKALLMLYFWDVIYNPEIVVPGSFISKLQSAPLDMFSPYFYENRKQAIDARLIQISVGWSEAELFAFGMRNYQNHSYKTAVFGMVQNAIRDVETVKILVTVIGRKILAKIFERLIKNIAEYSSGMPDLLLWNFDEKRHKFVEVKGEGDRLAVNQILWLRYLQTIGASMEVCYVHSTGSKRKKVAKTPSVENNVIGGGGGDQIEEGTSTTASSESECEDEDE